MDFKFLLRPKDSNNPCIIEEGPNRILSGGRLQGDARAALFRLNADAVLEYRICLKADRVSPFDLASSWRAYQHNIQPSAVRGTPDVSMNSGASETGIEVQLFCSNTNILTNDTNSGGASSNFKSKGHFENLVSFFLFILNLGGTLKNLSTDLLLM